jgi:hypothetical protein
MRRLGGSSDQGGEVMAHTDVSIVFATKQNTCEVCTQAVSPGSMIEYFAPTKTVAHATCALRSRRRRKS